MLGYEFLSMLSGCVAGELFGRLPVPIDVLPRRVTTDQKVQPCSRDAFIRNGWSASAATDSVVHGPDCFFHPMAFFLDHPIAVVHACRRDHAVSYFETTAMTSEGMRAIQNIHRRGSQGKVE
ncbi:hypothetical protein AFLA_004581 [Aspergillus flavus NRRL3357]|nr:hypothetical protein AFLA_004581 [Aspergillus flavus NRRL3357]